MAVEKGNRRAKVAMRVTSLRMGDDLWRLLEAEATRVGVSVSQYVREAALARASAAAGARGEDPFRLLGGVPGSSGNAVAGEPIHERRNRAFARASDVRHSAAAIQQGAVATQAESQQALRQAHRVKGAIPFRRPGAQGPTDPLADTSN
jgi:hypothetical protein